VPDFVPSVPLAKYTLVFNTFMYMAGPGHHSLVWIALPPFGRVLRVRGQPMGLPQLTEPGRAGDGRHHSSPAFTAALAAADAAYIQVSEEQTVQQGFLDKSSQQYRQEQITREKVAQAKEREVKHAEAVKQMEHICGSNEAYEIVTGVRPSRQERVQCDEFYRRGGRARIHPELGVR